MDDVVIRCCYNSFRLKDLYEFHDMFDEIIIIDNGQVSCVEEEQ